MYEGDLAERAFGQTQPVTCSSGGATDLTVQTSFASAFLLVVPRSASYEGSYGTSSDGRERPASEAACRPQAIAPCP